MDYVACQQGVYDCSYEDIANTGSLACSAYNNHYQQLQGEVWVVVLASLVMGGMGLAIGGNDVANAWGTSVGSGAIQVEYALVVAAISNVTGAILLGSGVADKLQHGVTTLDDPECFACGFCDSKMSLYSLGMLSALFAAAVFLFLATARKLPVSTTHAIVGGIVGITMGANRDIAGGIHGVLHGAQCVDWSLQGFGGMVMSWVVSPLLAGVLCCVMYTATSLFIHQEAPPTCSIADKLSSGAATTMDMEQPPSTDESSHSSTPSASASSATAATAASAATASATRRTLNLLPACYAGMTWTLAYLICSKSVATKGLSLGTRVGVASGLAAAVGLLVFFVLVPHITQQLHARHARDSNKQSLKRTPNITLATLALDDSTHSNMSESMDHSFNPLMTSSSSSSSRSNRGSNSNSNVISFEDLDVMAKKDIQRAEEHRQQQQSGEELSDVSFCFQYLLLCVAALESFAHGANDTANSTAAFSAVVRVYEDGLKVCSSELHTPMWVMAVGGSFVAVGVLLFGRGVIETIGKKLTSVLDCHKGFCIEFSSCAAVVCASTLGLPVSTTHCQVGAVVALGMQSTGVDSVDWLMVREIVLSWVLTVPFAALLAAGILNALKLLV